MCYKALVEQAKLMNDAGNKYPSVEKEDVEHAKTKKMELAKKIKLELTSKFQDQHEIFLYHFLHFVSILYSRHQRTNYKD